MRNRANGAQEPLRCRVTHRRPESCATLTLLPAPPSAFFAFSHIGSGNQFWIEANVQVTRPTLRALLRTFTFQTYHCAAESFHDLMGRVEYERRVRPLGSVRVS